MRLAVIALLLPALLAGRAATASSTVPSAAAGLGVGAVSGYTISEVSYSLAGDTIDGVSFTLAPAGGTTVKARLASGEPWATCTVEGGSAACPVSTPVADAASLEIVASGS
jgi:hypothetical protein